MANRVLFMGSKQLGLRVLKEIHALAPDKLACIVTIDDRSDVRTKFDEFEEFSRAAGLKMLVAENRRHSEQMIKDAAPDLCLVVGWYWLIGASTLSSVPRGFIGIHNSILPKFRGGSPLVWAMIRGEDEVGFSLFSFTPGMDDGPIWAQGRVQIDVHDDISTVLERLENETVEVLRRAYVPLLSGELTPLEQDHEGASYCAQRLPTDGNIDWRRSARDVYNFIRAQSDPYPGSFTYLDAARVKVWKARLFDKTYFGTPGQIARISSEGVYVICGDDRAILLDEIEIEGQRGRASDMIKSIKGRFSNAPNIAPHGASAATN